MLASLTPGPRRRHARPAPVERLRWRRCSPPAVPRRSRASGPGSTAPVGPVSDRRDRDASRAGAEGRRVRCPHDASACSVLWRSGSPARSRSRCSAARCRSPPASSAAAGVTGWVVGSRRPARKGRRRPDRRRVRRAGPRRDLALRRDRGRRPRAGRLSRPGPGGPRPDRARRRRWARGRLELTWTPSRRSAAPSTTTMTPWFVGSTTGPAAGLPATSCRDCGSATSPEPRGSPIAATAARSESRSAFVSQRRPATAVLHLVAVDPRSRRRGIGRSS